MVLRHNDSQWSIQGQPGQDGDDLEAQGGSAGDRMGTSGQDAGHAQQVVAMAAHRIHAEFAPNRREGMYPRSNDS